jgi:hypothetical protein
MVRQRTVTVLGDLIEPVLAQSAWDAARDVLHIDSALVPTIR